MQAVHFQSSDFLISTRTELGIQEIEKALFVGFVDGLL
jgi:hypothetical protein